MRDIKFRVWDSVTESFIYSDQIVDVVGNIHIQTVNKE